MNMYFSSSQIRKSFPFVTTIPLSSKPFHNLGLLPVYICQRPYNRCEFQYFVAQRCGMFRVLHRLLYVHDEGRWYTLIFLPYKCTSLLVLCKYYYSVVSILVVMVRFPHSIVLFVNFYPRTACLVEYGLCRNLTVVIINCRTYSTCTLRITL